MVSLLTKVIVYVAFVGGSTNSLALSLQFRLGHSSTKRAEYISGLQLHFQVGSWFVQYVMSVLCDLVIIISVYCDLHNVIKNNQDMCL
jgi:hypothetical protein